MKSCQSGVQGTSSSSGWLGPEKVGRGLLAADEKRIGGGGALGWGGKMGQDGGILDGDQGKMA